MARLTEAPQIPAIGATLAGTYLVESILPSRRIGTTLGARHQRTRKKVSLAWLHVATNRALDEALPRLRSDARALRALEHEAVVGIREIGLDGDAAFLVTDLVQGRSLRELLIAEGPLTPARAVQLLSSAMEGLDAAHEAGVVHHALEPACLVVTKTGAAVTTRVLDFGAALLRPRTLEREEAFLYRAPEQQRGRRADARADVWAIAVMLYELVAGHPPFEGPAYGAQRAEPESLDTVATATPNFAAAVERALREDPEERYPSLGAFLFALRTSLAPRAARVTTLPTTGRVKPPAAKRVSRSSLRPVRPSSSKQTTLVGFQRDEALEAAARMFEQAEATLAAEAAVAPPLEAIPVASPVSSSPRRRHAGVTPPPDSLVAMRISPSPHPRTPRESELQAQEPSTPRAAAVPFPRTSRIATPHDATTPFRRPVELDDPLPRKSSRGWIGWLAAAAAAAGVVVMAWEPSPLPPVAREDAAAARRATAIAASAASTSLATAARPSAPRAAASPVARPIAPPAPAPAPVTVSIRVRSEPEGAFARIGESASCITPCTLAVEQSARPLEVQLTLDGFRTAVRELVPESDTALDVDLRAARPRSRTRRRHAAPVVTEAPPALRVDAESVRHPSPPSIALPSVDELFPEPQQSPAPGRARVTSEP